MDAESFFKGVEVGRALRGWRTPDEAVTPTGTKLITANGTYDVADYATASVSVTVKDEADAEQIRSVMNYEWFRFPVFAYDASFRVYMQFLNVAEDEDGYATSVTWRVYISTATGAYNTEDYLAYIAAPNDFTLCANDVVPATLLSGINRYLAGEHTLTFTNGLTEADASQYTITMSSRNLPTISATALIGTYLQSDATYAINCSGEGWASYSGAWAGYFDITVQL